jgi:hypothetical protein
MSQPTAMQLFLPKDTDKPEEQNKAKESGALTILLGGNDNVFYYEGILAPDASNFKSAKFSGKDNIRNVIIDKKRRTNEKDLVLVIKPNEESTYKNLIDILDEMSINVIKIYALVDITPVENQLIHLTEQNNSK